MFKAGPAFLLAGAFMLLSPLSMATDLAASGPAKYVRLGTAILLVVFGAVARPSIRLGAASTALLVFVAFYVAASLWSQDVVWALFYKGMFAVSVLGGVLLGLSPRNEEQLKSGLRFLSIIAGFAGFLTFAQYLKNPVVAETARFTVFGLNANIVGMTAAALLLFCFFLALQERSAAWKWFSWTNVAILGIVIIATGSRGSLGMAVIGCAIFAAPLVRRPAALLLTCMLLTGFFYAVVTTLDFHTVDRLADWNSENRDGVWRAALRQFAASPVIGQGWLFTSRHATANHMSIYLQTLAEAGICGAVLLAVCLATIAAGAQRMRRSLFGRAVHTRWYGYFAVGLIASVLAHGIVESGTFLGSTLNSLLLGFGVGLIDRLPELATQELPIFTRPVTQRESISWRSPFDANRLARSTGHDSDDLAALPRPLRGRSFLRAPRCTLP